MFRKITAGVTLTLATVAGFSGVAHAVDSTVSSTKAPKENPLKCVGAADHKAAQASRLQALQSELAALNARLAVAQSSNNSKAVERIQGNITKVNARIAEVQANQAKFATKCP